MVGDDQPAVFSGSGKDDLSGIPERVAVFHFQIFRDPHLFKCRTVLKSGVADCLDIVAEKDLPEGAAAAKCSFPNGDKPFRKFNTRKTGTHQKGTAFDMLQALWKNDLLQGTAAAENTWFQCDDSFRKFYLLKMFGV